jgi:hypothetical protein
VKTACATSTTAPPPSKKYSSTPEKIFPPRIA